MKRLAISMLCVGTALCLANTAQAGSATAYVGTVNGTNAFQVQNGGNQLYFAPQPDTNYVWMENNGTAPGTIATYGGYNRDGMKTFACSNVGYGQRLDSLKMQFDYYTGADPTTGINMVNYPGINVGITDGLGHYGFWSPTSGGTPYVSPPPAIAEKPGWNRLTLDCTSLSENTWGKVNEYNGGLSTTQPMWSVIRGWTISGFYDFARSPEGGFQAWNQTLWSHVTTAGVTDPTPNQFGIVLMWGDTVGGCSAHSPGVIGAAADREYGRVGRLISDYTLTVGGTAYNMSFAPGVVPEPSTLVLLITAALGALCYAWRRRLS